MGLPITQWYIVGADKDNLEQYTDYALYVSFTIDPIFGWSCPVRVDSNLIRRSITIQSEEESVSLIFLPFTHATLLYIVLLLFGLYL